MPATPPPPVPVADPAVVRAVLDRDRAVHAYGIVDVAQFWATSRWWVRGGAVVGDVGLPGVDAAVVYAVAATDPRASLVLLADVAPALADRFDVTGPTGLVDHLAATHVAARRVPTVKLHLVAPGRVPADPSVRPLAPGDLPAARALLDVAGGTTAFLRADLVGSPWLVGLDVDGALAAVAGVHLLDLAERIAVIGNVATAPGHRGRGLARRVVATLVHRLLPCVDVVALNVGRDNAPARALYRRLGFAALLEFEEAALARR